MTEPMDEFERRLSRELHDWTSTAPHEIDYRQEANVVVSGTRRGFRRWSLVAVTVVAAALFTVAALTIRPSPEPVGQESEAPATATARPSSAATSPGATPSGEPSAAPSPVPSDLGSMAWFDLTDVHFGVVTGGDPDDLPDPYAQLRVGWLDGSVTAELHLAVGAVAGGPSGGTVVTAEDDGSISSVSLVSVATGEMMSLFEVPDHIKAIEIGSDGSAVYYVAGGRDGDSDRGLWRWTAEAGPEAIDDDAIWSENQEFVTWQMQWSPAHGYLAAEACRQRICATRILRSSDASIRTLEHGELLGMTDREAVFARGTETTATVIDLETLDRSQVDGIDGQAVLVEGGDAAWLAIEVNSENARAYRLDAVNIHTGERRTVQQRAASEPTGATIVRSTYRDNSGASVPPGWVLRWPSEGPPYPGTGIPPHEWYPGQLVRLSDGETVAVPSFVQPSALTDCEPVPPSALPSGAPAGDAIELYGGPHRWAAWGTGSDQVVQIVGGGLFGPGGQADPNVTVRGQAGRAFAMANVDGPFAFSWEEDGCRYEVQLAPGVSMDAVVEYAGRY